MNAFQTSRTLDGSELLSDTNEQAQTSLPILASQLQVYSGCAALLVLSRRHCTITTYILNEINQTNVMPTQLCR
jgi:hypothetical protein